MSELIINISPHRSATKNFTAFCAAHGLAARHWPGEAFDALAEKPRNSDELWDMVRPMLANGEVFSDLPWPIVYRQAAAALPLARFVLVRRPAAVWIASVRRHTADRFLSHLERLFYLEATGRRVDSLSEFSAGELLNTYWSFCNAALDELGSRLRIFNLGPDIGAEIAAWVPFEQRVPFQGAD
jgi:hypothetical protein